MDEHVVQNQLLRIIGSLVRGRYIPGFESDDDGDLRKLGVEYAKWLASRLPDSASDAATRNANPMK